MKITKRLLTVALVLATVLALLVTVGLAADTEAEQILSKEKDGLLAELTVTNDAASAEKIDLAIKVTNVSGANVSNIKVDVTLPEGIVLSSGSLSEALTLAVGESKDIAVSLTNTDVLPETEPETTPETDPETTPAEQKGCRGAIASAVSVIAVVGIALLLAKKNKKATISCLMLGAMLLGAFAFAMPTSAATTRRSIDLVGTVTYEDKEYSIEVSVSYDHTFTETDVEGTAGMSRFEISCFCYPSAAGVADFDYIAKMTMESGLTAIPVEGREVAANKLALDAMRKYGLRCSALYDNRILYALEIAKTGATQEEVDRYVSEAIADYTEYFDIIDGWYVKDEPSASEFTALGMVTDAIKRFAPDDEVMINLFPTYAKDSQLGTNGYQEYLDRFVAEVNSHYISYDNYNGAGQNNTDFYNNLELVREEAINSGKDAMIIILLTKHMGYADLNYDQIEWQINVSMTYGMKRISYFTFWLDQNLLDAGWKNAFMDSNGTVYPHYYDAQKANKWLLPLGTELFDKTSVGVFHVMERNTTSTLNAYTPYGDLGAVDAKNFLIGFFDDGSFMITNKDYAVEIKYEIVDGKPVVTEIPDSPFIFLDVDSGLQYFNTTTATWCDAEADGVVFRNADGKLERNFAIAEGILFRVVD